MYKILYLYKYSDPLLRTLLITITALSMMLQAWHTCVWRLSPFSPDPPKLCQVGWGALLHSNIQVSPDVWSGSSPGSGCATQRLVPKPLLRFLGCVLRVVVLLEGEPLPQRSWVLLRAGFHQGSLLYFALFICPSIQTSLPVPATEKHPYSLMLPP